jgi:hypothetical protein
VCEAIWITPKFSDKKKTGQKTKRLACLRRPTRGSQNQVAARARMSVLGHPGVERDSIRKKIDKDGFSSMDARQVCYPVCAVPAKRVHSHYRRTVVDLII